MPPARENALAVVLAAAAVARAGTDQALLHSATRVRRARNLYLTRGRRLPRPSSRRLDCESPRDDGTRPSARPRNRCLPTTNQPAISYGDTTTTTLCSSVVRKCLLVFLCRICCRWRNRKGKTSSDSSVLIEAFVGIAQLACIAICVTMTTPLRCVRRLTTMTTSQPTAMYLHVRGDRRRRRRRRS